jgi:glycosyltransferase involved in cell wall biosynthesis
MILLDAVFINNSGGKVLLDYLVSEICKAGLDCFYLFDDRCSGQFEFIAEERRHFIKGSLIERHRFYRQYSSKFEKVLCFGNLPPTIRLNAKVFTYFHNVSLFSYPANYGLKEKTLKKIKGKLITFLSRNTDSFIVQTDEVKTLLQQQGIKAGKVLVAPFYYVEQCDAQEGRKESFVFISNGNTHKNHKNLLQAWDILAGRNVFPELHLTVTDNYAEMINTIDTYKSKGLKIVNHGFVNAYDLYSQHKYLVYPSLCESFGLGLIEAVKCGCDVVASDLPYVFEVVNPTLVFDPLDPHSIADAITKILAGDNLQATTLVVENKIKEIVDFLK